MEFKDVLDAAAESGNRIIGEPELFEDSKISFSGKNNILYLESSAKLVNASIRFKGNNSVVYIGKGTQRFILNVASDATVSIGSGMYFHANSKAKIKASDRSVLLIGNQCLLSVGITISTLKKGNILIIGDHTWLAHGASVKGKTILGRHNIVAALSTVRDIVTEDHACYAGDGRLIMRDVLFSEAPLRKMNRQELQYRASLSAGEAFSLEHLRGYEDPKSLAEELQGISDPEERINRILAAVRSADYQYVHYRMPAAADHERGFTFEPPLIRNLIGYNSSDNRIIGSFQDPGDSSEITFTGTGNCLVCEEGVVLDRTIINFIGDNAVCYLSKSNVPYHAKIFISGDSALFFGHDNHFEPEGRISRFISAEGECVIIGDNNKFGSGVWCRNSDQHAIYSRSLKRINPAESVVICSGASVGDGCIIMKGAYIGDGETYDKGSLIQRCKAPQDDPYVVCAAKVSACKTVSKKIKELRSFSKRKKK